MAETTRPTPTRPADTRPPARPANPAPQAPPKPSRLARVAQLLWADWATRTALLAVAAGAIVAVAGWYSALILVAGLPDYRRMSPRARAPRLAVTRGHDPRLPAAMDGAAERGRGL